MARARWVAREILPYDRQIRSWFLRRGLAPEDMEEAVQDAYCRIAALPEVEHIANPGGYFFTIARHCMAQRLKRRQVVPLEAITDMDMAAYEEALPVEDAVNSRLCSEKLRAIIRSLPERCRRVVELRKIENWSQKDIAAHLGISEKAVEKDLWVGVKAVRDAWSHAERKSEARLLAFERRSGSH